MARHEQTNVSFDAPDEWVDGTVALFHPPRPSADSPAGPSIVIVREPLLPGHSLDTHVDRRIARLGKDLRGFELLPREDVVVGGRPGVLIRFRFRTVVGAAEQVIEHAMVMVDPAGDRERKVVVFSMRAMPGEAEALWPTFTAVLKSVRFEPTASRAPLRMPWMPGLRERTQKDHP
jgi:hypothetical protein